MIEDEINKLKDEINRLYVALGRGDISADDFNVLYKSNADKLLDNLYNSVNSVYDSMSHYDELMKNRSISYPHKLRKKEIAKEKGLLVGSIDDLACDKHPNERFEIIGKIEGYTQRWLIPDIEKALNKSAPDIYQCKSCGEGKKLIIPKKSKAYDCANCGGIVVGELVRRMYDAAGEYCEFPDIREGRELYCKLCDEELGVLD